MSSRPVFTAVPFHEAILKIFSSSKLNDNFFLSHSKTMSHILIIAFYACCLIIYYISAQIIFVDQFLVPKQPVCFS